MINLLSLIWITEEYACTLDHLLEDLDYYNIPCHKEVGNSRPAYTNRTKKLFNKKYTLLELLEDITPENRHEAIKLGGGKIR